MVDSVRADSVLASVRRLQDFKSRVASHDSCFAAAEWILAKFRSYGMDSVYRDTFTDTIIGPVAPNIVGIKRGTLHPDSCYIVTSGHFDAAYHSGRPDTAPGADDNASGTVAVLEAARIMRKYRFEHNIRFIAFSAEEFGMQGSGYYTYRARQRGDYIHAALNFDMIGYVDIEPESVEVGGNNEAFIDHFIACADTYTTLLTNKQPGLLIGDAVHLAYVSSRVLSMIEDWPHHNPYYHTPADTIGAGFNNLPFCTEVIKAGIGTLASSSRPVGIGEENANSTRARNLLMVYPNPTAHRVTIELSLPDIRDAQMAIYDATGRMVNSFRLSGAESHQFRWKGRDMSGKKLPCGVYFLRLKAGDYTETKKIVMVN